MITWQPLRVSVQPTGSITLSDCHAYLRLTDTDPEIASADRLIDSLRHSVVTEFEQRLNRAIFRQRRVARAILSYHTLDGVDLEPHTIHMVSTGTTPNGLTPVPGANYIDTVVRVIHDPPLRAAKRLFVDYEYACGWEPSALPSALKDAILDEIQRRYERQSQRVNKDGEVITSVRAASGKLPAGARVYRVGHDPVPLVSAG